MIRDRRVELSPSAVVRTFLSLPNESRTGVTSKVVKSTKNMVRELTTPMLCIGLMAITRKDSNDTTVVRPQNTTDQPISETVSITASLRWPSVRISPWK